MASRVEGSILMAGPDQQVDESMRRQAGKAGSAGGASRARELTRLAVAAAVVPLIGWAYWALVLRLSSNDFHDYWLAGKLLLQGHSPYDTQAMANLAASEHLTFLIGGGYSYPLPFVVAMAPLALLPFGLAIAVFNVASLVAFGLTVAEGIGWAFGWEPATSRRRLAIAVAAGLFLPVYGSIAMGQANLILFPLLGAGAVLAIDGATPVRRWLGGALLGLAAIVKLVPAVLIVPLALGRRFGAAVGLAVAALGAVGVAMIALPWATAGSGGLASLLDPDAFYSNQSINGFVTRLVSGTEKSIPIWSGGFDPRPVMLGLTAALGLATLAVLWRARAGLRTRRGAALGLGLALVAGVIGAPKTSFWNESIVLIAVGALLAVEVPDLRFGRLGRMDCALLETWFASSVVWAAAWAVEPPASGPLSAAITLLWSSSLYGLLALWLLFVRRLPAAQAVSVPAGSSATIS
jgi:alpha-1,2-mannosyltransferase